MSELLQEIRKKYAVGNRVYAAMLEVTHRCVCDCRHCLLAGDEGGELSLEEIIDILRQLRVEGVYSLGITGGEPFLRDDLPRVLAAARADRFFVSILTTGLLIGKAEVGLLRRLGIRSIELSLLGASAETHDGLMRHPGAFARVIRAAKMLAEAKRIVCLKCTVMRPNWHELSAMQKLAKDLGVRFSASVSVAPRINGDSSPQQLALTEDQVARIAPELVRAGFLPEEDRSSGALLTCNAGRSVMGISPQGDVFPCILLRQPLGNLRKKNLKQIWHDEPDDFLRELRAQRPEDVRECSQCQVRRYCRRCPGFAYLETRKLSQASPSACRAARGLAAAMRSRGDTL